MWTQVHSCHDTAWVSPTVANETDSPNCIWTHYKMPKASVPCTKQAVADKQLKLCTKWDTEHLNIWELDVKTTGKSMINISLIPRVPTQCLIIGDFRQLLICLGERILQCTSVEIHLAKNQELTSWIPADPTDLLHIRHPHLLGERLSQATRGHSSDFHESVS